MNNEEIIQKQQEELDLATIQDFVICCDQPNHPTTLVEKLPVNWQDDLQVSIDIEYFLKKLREGPCSE
jgi:hypothetical protein